MKISCKLIIQFIAIVQAAAVAIVMATPLPDSLVSTFNPPMQPSFTSTLAAAIVEVDQSNDDGIDEPQTSTDRFGEGENQHDHDDDDDSDEASEQPDRSSPPVHYTCVKPGMIALTFDDGPSPYTANLLSILRKERVKATFFTVGVNMNGGFTASIRRSIDSDSHLLGSHSNGHPDFTTLNRQAMVDDLTQSDRALSQALGGGRQPLYFRFPYGQFNTESLQLARQRFGYQVVQWNLDTNDWQTLNRQSVYQSVRMTVAAASADTESFIILMHDTYGETVAAIPQIISYIKRFTKFRFVTIDECLGMMGNRYKR